MTNAHRRRNFLARMKINSMWFTGEQAIKEGVALAFQQMFSTTGEWRPSLNGLVFEGL